MTMMSPTTMMGQNLKYPAAPKDNTVDEYFGKKVADPFRPLEDDTCAATAAWVKAENAVTDAYLAKIPQRNKYLKRLKQVANYEKVYTPFEKNGKWYVYKNNGLQNQAVLYQMDKLGGEARVFLDPNKLSDDGTVALHLHLLHGSSNHHFVEVERLKDGIFFLRFHRVAIVL